MVSCLDTGAKNHAGRGAIKLNLQLTPTPTPTPTPTIEIKRPGAPGTNEAVFIKADFCSCLKGKSDILNDCDSFCSTKNVQEPILYLNFTVGADIVLNDKIKDLRGWCKNEIGDGQSAPTCKIMYDDGFGAKGIDVEPSAGVSSLQVPMKDLSIGTIYQIYLKEQTSGAISKKVQLKRINPPTSSVVQGLIKISPITLFTCIFKTGTAGTFNNFDTSFKRHFLFVDQNQPPALPAGTVYTVCHDSGLYGINDSILFPRLEQIPNHFKTWDLSDSRFTDQINELGASTPNNKADINDIINKKLKDVGITAAGDYFAKLEWSSYPGTTNPPQIGYYLTPFTDPTSGRAICPDQADYNTNSPLMKILKETIGVDTEGIWAAQKEAECYINGQGEQAAVPDDVILIREHLLKKIWFYVKNGQPTEPTESIFNSNTTIHFYWPPDEQFPFTRKSTQKLYTIRYPTQMNTTTSSLCGSTTGTSTNSSSNSNGGSPNQGQFTQFMSADKRFGCIPAILD